MDTFVNFNMLFKCQLFGQSYNYDCELQVIYRSFSEAEVLKTQQILAQLATLRQDGFSDSSLDTMSCSDPQKVHPDGFT